jgi:hypothetical protein
MPFALIPTALGVCFLLIWLFIGAVVLRDGQLAAERDRENGPAAPRAFPGRGPTKQFRRSARMRAVS